MSKLIIWDIDGTLMHCFGTGRSAFEATYLELYNVPSAMQHISLAGVVDRQVIQKINAVHEVKTFKQADFDVSYEKHLRHHILGQGIQVIDGIKEVLVDLQRPGLYHVIGTGNCKVGAMVKLELSGLADYFTLGAYGDEVDTRSALLALAHARAEKTFKTRFATEDVMVIGDTPSDITSAKANDFLAVATTTGYYGEGDLSSHQPDFIIDHFKELLGVVENQWPKMY